MEASNQNVRDGYKMTELGEIPVEWEVVEQKEISTFINGRAYKQSEFKTDGTPIVRIQNLTGDREPVYSDLVLPEDKYIDNGDLIYAWSATFGPYIWKGQKSIYHYHIWKIEVDSSILDKLFYYYRLDYISNEMHSQKNGSAFAHITKGGMEVHKIALPPLKEQQKIAEILSTVDEQIENTEQLIEKMKELKKGLMQQLLTKGIGHTEFKQTELGEIPVEWGIKKIGEIADVTKLAGFEFTEYMEYVEDGEIIALRALNLKQGKLKLDDIKKIRREVAEKLPRSQLKIGDLLFSYVGTIGEMAIIDENNKYHLAPNVAKITCDSNLAIPLYLLNYLLSYYGKKEIKKYLTTTSQPALSMSNIRELLVIVPNLDEQKQIASILSSVDEQIESYEQEKEKYLELKKGLMQQLLSGKIRVTV